jgi:hypothetical protein
MEDLLPFMNNGFLWEKEMDLWRPAAGDPCPMEKNPDEIPCSPDSWSADWRCQPAIS